MLTKSEFMTSTPEPRGDAPLEALILTTTVEQIKSNVTTSIFVIFVMGPLFAKRQYTEV